MNTGAGMESMFISFTVCLARVLDGNVVLVVVAIGKLKLD